jgi:hypothetical protein
MNEAGHLQVTPNRFSTSKSMPTQTLLQPRFKSELNIGGPNLLKGVPVIGERSIGGFSPFFKATESKFTSSPKKELENEKEVVRKGGTLLKVKTMFCNNFNINKKTMLLVCIPNIKEQRKATRSRLPGRGPRSFPCRNRDKPGAQRKAS